MKFVVESVNGSNKVRLDISDIKVDKYFDDKKLLEQCLVFNASTYKPVQSADKDPEAFGHIMNGPNAVLGKLDVEDQVKVIKFFAHANYCIRDYLCNLKGKPRDVIGRGIVDFTKELGEQYLTMVKETNLVEKFREYTRNSIKMQDTSTFGTRPQDTRELTFNEDEMRETMVLACFCKLLAPIFGEIINNLPEYIGDDGKKRLPRDKEAKCVTFLSALIGEYFVDIVDKLQNYIHHIVMNLTSKNQDSAIIFYGLTPNTRTNIILSSLLVRNYVGCELEKPDSNIIRYTDTLVRTLASTQSSTANRAQVKTRKAPGAMMMSDDASNTDHMEVNSLVSIGTMDGPILVKCAIDDVVTSHRRSLEVSRAEFNQCLDFFKEHPIKQTPLNMFAVTAVFGREIGGGRGVEMIASEPYTKLVAILQLIAFSMGFVELGNFLTAAKSSTVKMQLSLEDENFKRQATTLSHYRACREQFSRSTVTIGDQMWDKQMAIILDDMAYNIYTVNTPDYILETVPEGASEPIGAMFNNGDTLIPSINATEELCSLIQAYNRDLAE